MESKLRIQSTILPEETLDYTQWCKTLKVSSRVPKERQSFTHLICEYDFSKLNKRNRKFKLI